MNEKADWQNKCWGKTRQIISSDFYSKHELQVSTGGYCSLHYHQNRANKFIVKSGCIDVIEFYGPTHKVICLGPDNTYDVPSLVPHLFVVMQDGLVIEEYYSDRGGRVMVNDIVRIVEGGMLSKDEIADGELDCMHDFIRRKYHIKL
tara:strand:- start:330 stop:770 length:441 start_codon:yes stop_codon:yes gene_type:complete